MKKSIHTLAALLLSLSVLFCLAACSSSKPVSSGSAENPDGSTSTQTYNLIMSIEDSADSPNTVACTAWADELKEASGGRLNITIYPGATLASPVDVLNMCESGGVDLAWTAVAANTGRFPILEVTNTPNIGHYSSLQCTEALQKLYTASPEIQAELETINAHLLAIHGCGVSMLATTDFALDSAAAFKGVQLRCNNGNYASVVTKLGAATMACSQGELYENLEKNVIEGNLTDLSNLINTRSYEICKNIMNYSFGSSTGLVFINQTKYDALPADLQQLLNDRFESLSYALGEGFNNYVREFLNTTCEASGVNVYAPSDDVVQALNAASVDEIHQTWIASMDEKGLDGQAMLDQFKAAFEAGHETYGAEYDWVQ